MKNVFAFILLTLTFVGCTGIKTSSDYDPTINFSEYKTAEFYGWDKNTSDDLNDFDRKRIVLALTEEFQKKGIELKEKGSGGDLIVSLYLTTEQRSEITATTTHNPNIHVYVGYGGYYGYGPGWGYGPGYGGYSTTHISESEINEGTLICSVFDAEKKQLIYESISRKTIDENPQIRKKSIPYIVRSLMREYPKKKK